MQAIVLAAGKGTRMRSDHPKVLHEILGRPLLQYALAVLSQMGFRTPKVVIGNQSDEVRSFVEKCRREIDIRPEVILQKPQLGTGHAVMTAEKSLRRFGGDILVWPGDMPLVKRETLEHFLKEHQTARSDASVLSSLQINPHGYGRILRAGGRFYGIREELDATPEQRRIQEVNTGVYLFKAKPLFKALRRLRPDNRKKEFYLTDTLEILSKANRLVHAFPLASAEEGKGINNRMDLAMALRVMKNREIVSHSERGVTFVSPEQTFVAPGVQIGQDTVIQPWCYIESKVKIGKRCQIGPFAKIREGSVIGDDTVVGSFVEVTRSRLGKKVMAKHLAYLGDATIGDGTNVGAGTITANFDGKKKHPTRVGKKVLIGCDTIFVAPVRVPDKVRTGAGAVIAKNTKIKKGEILVGVPAKRLRRK
jgi:bifunctional UDP-N-acetylglucosamine pyrophosphorylase/glucosamine-1-phosphate N-acetyltransferase